MKKLLKEFLKDNDGLEGVEYLAVAAILIALILSALWVVGGNTQAEGMNVAGYIDGINAPASP